MKLDLVMIDSLSNIQLLRLSGNIEKGYITPPGEDFTELCKGPPVRLILDLLRAQRISDSGIGDLIKARNDITAGGGNIVLIGVNNSIEKMIQNYGLQSYFPFAASLSEAVELFNANSEFLP